LSLLLGIFLNNLLPVFLCASTGFALGRAFTPDLKTVTRLSFYIFGPCLVFTSLTKAEVTGGEFAQLALYTLLAVGIMIVLAVLAGLALRVDRRALVTLIIASVFVNGGNYGLAATRFAFGDDALARAVVYFVFSTLTLYTVGIFIASLGKQEVRQALGQVAAVPAFYSLVAASFVRGTGWPVPTFLDRAISLLGEASIPLMLVILGLQIAQTRAWPKSHLTLIGVAVALQLVVAPLVALGLSYALGLTGVARQAVVLQTSMPAAVVTTILALQYDLDAELVSGTVILSTLLSPLTLTPLIAFLQRI
jgi:hypothetical protein